MLLETRMHQQPVWRAVCTNSEPKKLPPIPIATTSFNAFPVAPTYTNIISTLNPSSKMIIYQDWLAYYPRSTSDPLRELLDFIQNFPNIWDNIVFITLYNSIPWSTKGYMKHRSILSAVYLKVKAKLPIKSDNSENAATESTIYTTCTLQHYKVFQITDRNFRDHLIKVNLRVITFNPDGEKF